MHRAWALNYKCTAAEQALEPYIAALGFTYRTQFPMFLWGGRYFPDFCIFPLGVIVEVDDSSHSDDEKRAADAQRTEELARQGWRVVRCTNEEALTAPQVVIARINDLVAREGRRPISLPVPLPRNRKKRSRGVRRASPPRS